MFCTFSCAHEQAGRDPRVVLITADLPVSPSSDHISSSLFREKTDTNSWVKLYSALDLHFCYNNIILLKTILPLKHSKLNNLLLTTNLRL